MLLCVCVWDYLQHLESPHCFVLVFELMEGGDLAKFLLNRQKDALVNGLMISAFQYALPEDEARHVFNQVPPVCFVLHGYIYIYYINVCVYVCVMISLFIRDVLTPWVQIVSAVGYAHNQHICHRDLKLENILLKSNNLSCVKIADFGLSAFYR